MSALVQRARRAAAALTPVKPMILRNKRSVVSFTFDDFPASAGSQTCLDILRRHNARATYYTAAGLRQTSAYGQTMFDDEDFHRVLAQGHEIGCHTFSHAVAQELTAAGLAAEFDRNASALREQYGVEELHSFAFPRGVATLSAKHLAAKRFATARGTRSGLHSRWADLAQLRANRIGPEPALFEAAMGLIARAQRGGAWLIFYTHDVGDAPSPYGSTSDQLDRLLSAANESGCVVLPIRNALGYISQPGH